MADEKKSEQQKLLNRYVTVGSTTYGPGDELPAEVAEQITNPKAWAPADSDERSAERVQAARNGGTSSGARLATPVTVGGVTYSPDDHIPDDIAAKITNPKAWEGGKLPIDGADKTAKTEAPQAPAAGGEGGGAAGEAAGDGDSGERAPARRAKRG